MENVSFSIIFLVRMTGFEPTRLATLEPDGNVTSVETPIPVLSLFTYLVYHRNRIKSSDFDSLFLFSSHLPPGLLSCWAVSFLSDMAKNYTALNKEESF